MPSSIRTLIFLIVALALWSAPTQPAPSSQAQVTGELFARPGPDGLVQLALRVEVPQGFHIYHEDLGPKDAVGKPTKAVFQGVELVGPVLFPEPIKHTQKGAGADGKDTWIWSHAGTVVLLAKGRLAPEGKLENLSAKVSGLICDEVGCTPFSSALKYQGPGEGKLFAALTQPASGTKAGAPAADPAAQVSGQGANGKVRGKLYVRASGDTVDAVVEMEIEEGFHIYHDELQGTEADGMPTEVKLSGAGITWQKPEFPAPEEYSVEGVKADGGAAVTLIQEGTVLVRAKGRLATPGALENARVRVEGQVCDDVGCDQFEFETASAGRGTDEVFAAATSVGAGSKPTTGKSPAQGQTEGGSDGLGGFLLAAVFGALFALVMPCTYPMIPITISFFSKQAGADSGKRIRLALAYGLGIILIFIVIGAVVGPVITRFANHPWTNVIIGTFFIVFAMSLFGLFELRPPQFLMGAAGQARSTGGYLGVFLMGATLVITSFTCTAPFVGSLLSYGASQPSLSRVVMGMGVFGLTMAIPFVGLALVPGKLQAMPKSGEWMHTFKVFMGFVELAAAFKFISNADLVWQWQILNRELFLILWCGIFLVAGVFLLGFVKMEGESHEGIGATRLMAGTATLTFALYCGWGALGNQMDRTMTAIIPPYSALGPGGTAARHGARNDHTIVVDNYVAARDQAKAASKYLLINFTGYN